MPQNYKTYPLAAIVGQERMLEALMLLAVDPSIGGLLLLGEKGTAKSTAARALAEILPSNKSVADCPYHCRPDEPAAFCFNCNENVKKTKLQSVESPSPFRTVPLGVTEDRLLGGLDWEGTLKNSRLLMKPGILGECNGGLLYIDEVNLLETSLAHLLLDAASTGRVYLERDGISASYPANIALLGTMNPEEGQLGPQLADRFSLQLYLKGESKPQLRAEVVRRRLAFEKDPSAFRRQYALQSENLRRLIADSRNRLKDIVFSKESQALISHLVISERVAGHRGDLALAKTARAKAALLSQNELSPRIVLDIADLILPSRRRPAPAKEALKVKIALVEKAEEDGRPKLFEPIYLSNSQEIPPEIRDQEKDFSEEESIVTIYKTGESFQVLSPQSRREVGVRGRSGRRSSRETDKAIGRFYRTTARRMGRPLSLFATLRAAAPYQARRKQNINEGAKPCPEEALRYHNVLDSLAPRPESELITSSPLVLKPSDFREKVYRQKTGRLVIFVVDSSGSIGTLYRMEEAKAAVLALLSEAYQKRDRVALIAFYGLKAEMLLPPTNSPDLAARLLSELPSGGKTPLAAALFMTQKLLRVEQAKDPALNPYVILMTDGRPNIPLDKGANPWQEALSISSLMAEDPNVRFLLIDTDRGAYNDFKLTRDLAEKLKAPRINIEELREGKLEAWLENLR